MSISNVKIILVESAGPLNVGSVARVMKNFGLNQLVLVNPQCDHLGDEAKLMAVRARDILETAILVETLPEALQGCRHAIATTGTDHDLNVPLESPRTALPWLLETVGQPAALIFGREDRGLTNQELNYAQRFVRIPSSNEYTSLNLAAAVGVCCYELAQSILDDDPPLIQNTSLESELAPLDVVESYYQQLESLLLDVGFLYPHTASSRMEKFRQLYNRAQLRTQELSMLRGILRQLRWSLSNKNNQQDL
jgi:tRNA/rRNA methyltransferase